jgi:tetratricopeptide (TPR) repeat protein
MMDLKKSLMCYEKSESSGGTINPDLYFNRGNVLRYMQQYDAAVAAYSKAATIDPNIEQTSEAIDEIREFVARTKELVASGGKLKKKKLTSLTAQLAQEISATSAGAPAHNAITLGSDLATLGCCAPAAAAPSPAVLDRQFPGTSVALKVVMWVTKGTVPPESFLCVDSKGNFVVVSVYNLAMNGASQFNTDDTVVIVDPIVKDVYYQSSSAHGASAAKEFCFSTIQVLQLEKISVGGKFLNRSGIAAPTMSVDVFEA